MSQLIALLFGSSAVLLFLQQCSVVQAAYCSGFSCSSPCYYCGKQSGSSSFGNTRASNSQAGASSGSTSGLCNANCRALASCAGWTGGNQGFGGSRGVFRDVNVGEAANTIKDELTACKVFIEQYVEEPVRDEKDLIKIIADKFYSANNKDAKDDKNNENGLKPSTFHCCHSKFAKQLFPNSAETIAQPKLPEDVTCASLVTKLYKELTKTG